MSAASRRWLPLGAASGAAIDTALDKAVANWSSQWFGDRAMRVVSRELVSRTNAEASAKADWVRIGCVFRSSETDQLIGLACRAMGVRRNDIDRTREDGALLHSLGTRIADSLGQFLTEAFAQAGREERSNDPFEQGGLILVARGGGETIRIGIPSALLIEFRLSQIETRHEPFLGESTLIEAVSAQEIRYAAEVGEATLSAAEILGLANGDIIVLKRATSDGALIVSDRSRLPIGRAAIESFEPGVPARLSMLEGQQVS